MQRTGPLFQIDEKYGRFLAALSGAIRSTFFSSIKSKLLGSAGLGFYRMVLWPVPFEHCFVKAGVIWVHAFNNPSIRRLNMKRSALNVLALSFFVSILLGCAGGSISKREAGAGIGALGGAAVGGAIGAATRHPGIGAGVGAALGAVAGALIGDQLQGQDKISEEQQRQIQQNQAELERLQKDREKLQAKDKEY
jgi:outer membrane protein with glycine zipper